MKSPIFLLLFASLTFHSLQAQINGSTKEDFLRMAKYLSDGPGKWMSPNPKYDPENLRSSLGVGLWFTLEMKENLLRLTHVSYRRDTAHVTGESYWLWHPGEQKIKYYGTGIGFTDGETYFTADDKFTTFAFSYSANGKIQRTKDDNFIISENEHRAVSYYFEKNEWHQNGDYTFNKTGRAGIL